MRSNNGRRLERNRKFVDSPLEGEGFELSVPREIGPGYEALSFICRHKSPGAGILDMIRAIVREAGFRYVFLGIENILQEALRSSEPNRPAGACMLIVPCRVLGELRPHHFSTLSGGQLSGSVSRLPVSGGDLRMRGMRASR